VAIAVGGSSISTTILPLKIILAPDLELEIRARELPPSWGGVSMQELKRLGLVDLFLALFEFESSGKP
jgi:hypothetical protein